MPTAWNLPDALGGGSSSSILVAFRARISFCQKVNANYQIPHTKL